MWRSTLTSLHELTAFLSMTQYLQIRMHTSTFPVISIGSPMLKWDLPARTANFLEPKEKADALARVAMNASRMRMTVNSVVLDIVG